MPLPAWYKVVTPRPEVREGRSFSPDEFAIALDQVVAGTAPPDYRDPTQFFSRTVFTDALTDHLGMVLRRLDGRTANTAPVLSLVTQFGGGKTHTLTALYHLVTAGSRIPPNLDDLRRRLDLSDWPSAKTAVFVGGAWDPKPGRETPWMEIAWQVAGDAGLAALGASARRSPPGTETLGRVFAMANGPILLLFDEVLNFLNRHDGMADHFHAFLQNLTVAVTGATRTVAVMSLPRSQTEMTERDLVWQERITKIVGRVAQDLMANDESDISEVVRRRLFDHLGEKARRRRVARAYAAWCFERSARLPPQWFAADAAQGNTHAQKLLERRFEAAYPFHPATLSVFRRKWQPLPQFQQTRGALAMLARWVSWAAKTQFQQARTEPLLTLGSAPLENSDFRAIVLGQLGEQRLDAAIEADLTGDTARALPLDADMRGPLRDIHRRVGTTVLFESSGGQVEKEATLPELRFALTGPEVDTATIDNAAVALERSAFFIRKVGSDGYRIHQEATLRKVVADRRASLDEKEVRDELLRFVRREFERQKPGRRRAGFVFFPDEGPAVPDSPRLNLVVLDPGAEWRPDDPIARQVAGWTERRGLSPRLYPGCLIWCVKKPGRELQDRVETLLAWRKVKAEVDRGDLGPEHSTDAVRAPLREAADAARDEVWAGYRYLLVADRREKTGLRVLDLGAGHPSSSDTLPERIVSALMAEGLLNETVGAGYIDRNWPPEFRESGAWPLTGLRQSFLSGALTRLLDTDRVLQQKIPAFVQERKFGLASQINDDGRYERLWYGDLVASEEVAFEDDVYLLTRKKAEEAQAPETSPPEPEPPGSDEAPPEPPEPDEGPPTPPDPPLQPDSEEPPPATRSTTVRLVGNVPSESWNRIGTTLVTTMRSRGKALQARIELTATVRGAEAEAVESDLRRQLQDLKLDDALRLEHADAPDEDE